MTKPSLPENFSYEITQPRTQSHKGGRCIINLEIGNFSDMIHFIRKGNSYNFSPIALKLLKNRVDEYISRFFLFLFPSKLFRRSKKIRVKTESLCNKKL